MTGLATPMRESGEDHLPEDILPLPFRRRHRQVSRWIRRAGTGGERHSGR